MMHGALVVSGGVERGMTTMVVLCCAWPCVSSVGVKISDAARLQAAGVDTGLVAQRATEAYLMQVREGAWYQLLGWLGSGAFGLAHRDVGCAVHMRCTGQNVTFVCFKVA